MSSTILILNRKVKLQPSFWQSCQLIYTKCKASMICRKCNLKKQAVKATDLIKFMMTKEFKGFSLQLRVCQHYIG